MHRKLSTAHTLTQMPADTTQIKEVLDELEHSGVMLPQPEPVRGYLLHHPEMVDLLPLVCKLARDRLGLHTELSLEVYHDPEIEDEYLMLYVRQRAYASDILDVIEDINAEYEAALTDKPGWLLVTTDFQPPR